MVKKEISVSIIMPTFEIDKTEPALKDLLKQDYLNKEIIIINDNPESKISPSMMKLIKDNKIKIINNSENLGSARSLNKGIKAAKTEIISIFCRDYLLEGKNWLKHSVEKLYSDKRIGQVISGIETEDKVWRKYPFLLKLFTFRLILRRSMGGGVSYKKEVFRKIGLFDDKTFRFAGEDGDMNYRMKKSGYQIASIDDYVIHNHFNEDDKLLRIFKKEYNYGRGHGARKRKYGILKRQGLFDFDIRLLFILGIIIGLFIHPLISLFCFLPFFFAALKQTFNPFSKTKWIPGLILYPFAGFFIFVIQTFGAVKEYFRVKPDKYNKNIEYLKS